MPPPQANTLNCIILQSKLALKEIPHSVMHYFINSKRRFFVYFKSHEQMIDTMRILAQNNVRFYRRQSILPDREEHEELVYHCNYRYKRQDLRKNLYHSTPYNDPKVLFDKYQKVKKSIEQPVNLSEAKSIENNPPEVKQVEEKLSKSKSEESGSLVKNQKVLKILSDPQLLRDIFRSMNVGSSA